MKKHALLRRCRIFVNNCRVQFVLLLAGIAVLGLFWFARRNRNWMDWFIRHISMPWKRAVSALFDPIPYSVGELICAGLVIALMLAALFTLGAGLHGRPVVVLRRLLGLAAIGVWAYVGMCVFWGVHYYGTGFQEKAGLEAKPMSVSELWYTTEWFRQKVEETAESVPRDAKGRFRASDEVIFSQFPQVYETIGREYPCLAQGPQRTPKRAVFSRMMSRAGFTGYLFPYSGEATLNMDAPQVFLPVTIAHESSHQRGVAPEQEANFVGIAASISSGLPVYEYSGYLFGWLQLSDAMYKISPKLYAKQWEALCPAARIDLAANGEYWRSLEGPVRQAAEKTYTGFLHSYGQVMGMQSYGACVDLLVARYCPPESDRTGFSVP